MKHFFGATPDGRLFWSFIRAGGYDGTTVDLDANDPQDAHAQHLLSVYNKNMKSSETLDCIVVFECPCPPGGEATCNCAATKRLNSYCNAGTLTDKPTCQLLVDGVPTTNDTKLTRYPNSLFTIQLTADTPGTIPDGEVAQLYSRSMLETESATLTFTNDVTNTITLRAPAQGLTGSLNIIGRMICRHGVFVKGFSATP